MTAPASIDALVFDVGGVIVNHENHLLYERLAARCSTPHASERIEAALRDRKWDVGAAPITELHAQLQSDLGYDGDWNAFLEDWTCHFTLKEPMAALVHELAQGNRVILFSNTNEPHWNHLLARYPGVLDPFERFLSHEIRLSKPDVASFDHVARAAGITPARSLFFDDRIENVEGARRAGFFAEIFSGRAALERYLAEAGVTP